MKNEPLTHQKKLLSGFLLTVTLLLSFFMLSGNVGFSVIPAQKTQTEVLARFRPLAVAGINYYDNTAVVKKLHFPWSDKNQVNALFFHHKMMLIKFIALKQKAFLISAATSFYRPKTIPQSQDEDSFSLMG
ncbi:hypothetical protein SAMN05421820_101195 [Pedobacter steynii]|uniref:Uncharacterized protein n=1 Tax=Pedobacter steynii TaxID=430522 RepID=A0A1G9J9D8_9SPHI|nr:hypothetical protein [Pedobacter steynii]NQX38186.1 hypothetical protein [Pedobacter steynii]SDL34217.1 hypothetical protein SAMN05421820_101195 [Pedobacter steynii]